MIILICQVVAALVALFYAYHFYLLSKHGLTGPLPLPIIGTYAFLADISRLHNSMHKMFVRYGEMSLVWMGYHWMIFVNRPKLLKQILSTQMARFDRNDEEELRLQEFLGGGLITARNGSGWKRGRACLGKLFHRQKLEELVPFLKRKSASLLTRLLADDRHDQSTALPVVEVEELCLKTTFDVIFYASFGKDLMSIETQQGQEKPKELTAFEFVLEHSHWRLLCPVRHWEWFGQWLSSERKYERALSVLRDTIDEQIHKQQHLSAQEAAQHTDLLSALLQDSKSAETTDDQTDETSANTPLSVDEIRSHLLTFLFAGHDTTASLLSWSMYNMAKYPEMAARMRQEAEDVIGGDTQALKPEHLSKLTYQDAFVKETLRLFPPVPLRGREMNADAELGGMKLRKGDLIVWSAYCMHLNPEHWENPTEFRPERHLIERHTVDREERRDPFAFLPFGAGSRRCIGEQLALMEVKTILSTLCRHVEFGLVPGVDYGHQVALTLRATAGVGIPLTVSRLK